MIACDTRSPSQQLYVRANGEVRRAACWQASRQAAPAQPSLTPRACDLRPLRASIPTRPHATRLTPPEIPATTSQAEPPSAINHGVRTPLPLPQAAMAQQRQHAHSRRLPSRWSCMRHCPRLPLSSSTPANVNNHSSPSLCSSSSMPPATPSPPSTAPSSTSPSWIGSLASFLPSA